jgi:5-dehydro-4-deoxyglucarate dehydratase
MSLELHQLASKDDYAGLKKLMNEFVIPLYAFRQRRRGYEVSVMKEMMMQIGLVAGPVRPPLLDPTAEEKAEIRTLLERWRPWL